LWGAPRIHGELLKLGFEIAESTVSKYMIRRRGPPSQTWRTFLRTTSAIFMYGVIAPGLLEPASLERRHALPLGPSADSNSARS
jgi:hypothetical protein